MMLYQCLWFWVDSEGIILSSVLALATIYTIVSMCGKHLIEEAELMKYWQQFYMTKLKGEVSPNNNVDWVSRKQI